MFVDRDGFHIVRVYLHIKLVERIKKSTKLTNHKSATITTELTTQGDL